MTELNIAQNALARTSRAGKTREQYNAEIRAKRTHNCLHCKKEYVSTRRHLTEGHKYCSKECYYAQKADRAKLVYSKVFFNTCVVCASRWVSKRKTSAWCSVECGKEQARRLGREYHRINQLKIVAQRQEVSCAECKGLFVPSHGSAKYCSQRCSDRAIKCRGSNADRAKAKGLDRGYFNERRILVRDKWTCKLCGIKTPEKLRGKNLPNSPEIDHIIPLSQGGVHRQHNLQCACRKCNGKKGSKPLGQLIMHGFGDIV